MNEVPLYPFAYEGPEPPTPCTPHAHISQVNPHMNAAGFQPHRVRVDLQKVRCASKLPHAHEQPRAAPFYSQRNTPRRCLCTAVFLSGLIEITNPKPPPFCPKPPPFHADLTAIPCQDGLG